MELTAGHDGRLVADVVTEWARRHGQPFTLTLTGVGRRPLAIRGGGGGGGAPPASMPSTSAGSSPPESPPPGSWPRRCRSDDRASRPAPTAPTAVTGRAARPASAADQQEEPWQSQPTSIPSHSPHCSTTKPSRNSSAAGAANPAGRIHHSCFGPDDALMVYEVWESQQAFEAYGPVLMPILEKAGIDPGTPDVMPVHDLVELIQGPAPRRSRDRPEARAQPCACSRVPRARDRTVTRSWAPVLAKDRLEMILDRVFRQRHLPAPSFACRRRWPAGRAVRFRGPSARKRGRRARSAPRRTPPRQ